MIRNSIHVWNGLLRPSEVMYQQQKPVMSTACFLGRFRFHLKDKSISKLKSLNERKISNGKLCMTSFLLKPTIFTISVSTASFTAAAIWQYENMKKRAREIFSNHNKWFQRKSTPKRGVLRRVCCDYWNSLSEGEKIYFPILLTNVLVYFSWKIPGLRGIMMKHFLADSGSKSVCLPMILSSFSHFSILHLFFNMFALKSFMPGIVDSLGKEQFLAFYFSSAVIANYISHLYRGFSSSRTRSLGASGAIMAVFSYTCFKFPDTELALIFLPYWTFTAETGILLMMTFDTVGLIAKFKLLDHACHLGGAWFGAFWCFYGVEYIWMRRGPLLEWWHKVRTPKQ